MNEIHVVTCFLQWEGKVLLFKRSGQVGTYRQKWAGISGYLEEPKTPFQQALSEIEEETGLSASDCVIAAKGEPIKIIDREMDRTWVVHPFRFLLHDAGGIQLDWEHSEYRWIEPDSMAGYDTVPGLYEAWSRVK